MAGHGARDVEDIDGGGIRSIDSTDLLALFNATRAWCGEPLTTMDVLASMSRGAREGLGGCGDPEGWDRIASQTDVNVARLPARLTDEAQAERLETPVTVAVCGEGFRVSKAVDRALGAAQWLVRHYSVDDVTPWLLAAGVAVDATSGAGQALRGTRSPVWLAQLLMRELALSELDGLGDLLEGRPNPPRKKWSEGDDGPEPDTTSRRFFAEAARPVVSGLAQFWSLTPRLSKWRERALLVAVSVPVAGVALVVAPLMAAAALALGVAAMVTHVRGRVAIGAVLAALGWWAGAHWWIAVAAILAGLLLHQAAAVARRPFVARLSGWRVILRGSRRRRAERFVAHAYPVSALAEYEQLLPRAGGMRRIRLLADAAYAACDAEQYQRALDLATLGLQADGVDSRAARRQRARLNVAMAAACVALEQLDRARTAAKAAYAILKDSDHRLNHALIAVGEAGQAAGHPEAARHIASKAATRALRRLQWVAAAEYALHLGQMYIRKGQPADAWVCFYHARRLADRRYFAFAGEYDDPPAYGAWRPVLNVMAQTEIGMGEAQMLAGFEFRPEHSGTMPDVSDGLAELQMLERPLDLARAHQVCAEIQRRGGRPDQAIHHLFAALGIIDRNRYLIRDPATRLRWIKANLQVHRLALAAAHEYDDHAGVCELLEIGRLQGIPALAKDALAAGGDADIPLQPPPRVMIAGRSHLVDADGVSADSDVVELTLITRYVAGDRGMLLSYWTNEDGCYWALLGPHAVHSGRLDLAAPGLTSALKALQDGLPLLLDGESAEARKARVLTGPFYSDRQREEDLALALSAVLPASLRQHLATLGRDKTVSLVICPSPELARVPWPLLAIPEAATGSRAPRLLELADLHLGLTSALNREVHRQITDDYTTDIAVVIDPSGDTDLAAGRAAGLPKAHRMVGRLPPTVRIHGGRWLGDGDPTTLERFTQIMRAVPRGGSVVFVGHCKGPDQGESAAEAALVFASRDAAGENDRLSARSLLHPPTEVETVSFPAKVVLAACNTASADHGDTGDWLSLVPAVHWAGAREVVSSTVSVPDRLYRLESSLIRWLSEEADTTLSGMLMTLQRDALRGWLSGEDGVPPLSWAFYLHSGVATVSGSGSGGAAQPAAMMWSTGAMKKVRDAAKFGVNFRRRILSTRAVATSHIGYEVDDAESLAAMFIVYPMFAWDLAWPGQNPIPLLPGRQPRPSKDWPRLIEAAETHARDHHRGMVFEIDVLSVLMQPRNLPGSWLIRRLANVRHAAVRDRQIREAHTAPQWLHASTPQWLYPAQPRTDTPREAALLAQLGFTEQWLRRNTIACRRATFDRGFGSYYPIQQRHQRDQAINKSRFPPRHG